MKITKASGLTEELDPAKLRNSLIRSGADPEQAGLIIDSILKEIHPLSNTKKIYRVAKKYLRQINHASGLRYSLKRALFRLGPSGYPFEKYVAEVLKHYGYRTQTGIFIEGKCVRHEIDVFAVKDDEVSLVECKYHNRAGTTSDVKTAMYVHARFQDLKPVINSQYPGKKYNSWLITNTRCTSDAEQYAECSGLQVKSWRYPEGSSLQKMIEDKKLYPVTIISGVKSRLIKTFFDHDIVLIKDLAGMEAEEIELKLSLKKSKAKTLKKQADALCLC
ncbi:MAG: restriction endonuclease [Nitrospirota bacterium]